MSETAHTAEDTTLHTIATLRVDFSRAGLEAGMHVLVHSSMRSIGGWICGGVESVIIALQQVITAEGTLMMPTHTSDNSDPQYWRHPPVPAEWWPIIREQSPPYHPQQSVTRLMGTIAENFRRFPGVLRSPHPLGSFAAWGRHAALLTQEHPLDHMFGEHSPLARLYELGGYVFLLGVDHGNNTSLHLAEHRASFHKVMISEGSAVLVNGERQWVQYTMLDYDDDDFPRLGAAYESLHHPHIIGQVGRAVTRLLPMRALVDFGAWWLGENRP